MIMGYQFAMTLTQMGFSSHSRIYNSSVLLVLMIVFVFALKPFKFRSNNIVWLSLQCSLLIFLILATSFPTLDFQDESAQDKDETQYSMICIFALSLGLAIAAYFTLAWVVVLISPRGVESGRAAKLAFQFRDVNRILALIPNQEFLGRVRQLGEADLRNLERSLQSVVAIFLHRQPSKGFFGQRLMPNVAYKRWQPHETMLDALDAIFGGELHRRTSEDAEARLALLLLACELRDLQKVAKFLDRGMTMNRKNDDYLNKKLPSLSECAKELHNINDKALSEVHRRLNLKEQAQEIAELLGMSTHSDLDRDSFFEKLRPYSNLSDSELQRAFDLLDTGGAGRVSVADLVQMLVGAAPPLSEALRARLLQTKSFASMAHPVGDGALVGQPSIPLSCLSRSLDLSLDLQQDPAQEDIVI